MGSLEEIDINKNPLFVRDNNGNLVGIKWSSPDALPNWPSPQRLYPVSFETMPPREPTELERIQAAFERKFDQFSGNDARYRWSRYLVDIGLEQSLVEILFENLYAGNFDKVAVKDPDGTSSSSIIIMDREFAKKVLVLGDLP